MIAPTIQTRLLASPPIFIGSWGVGIWSLYQLSQHDSAWPLCLASGAFVAAVMKADAQVKAYTAWKRDWDAMAGTSPPARTKALPSVRIVLGLLLALPLASLLLYAGQHGGSQAMIGVCLVLGAPVLAIAGLVRLWRRVRRGRAKRSAQVEPVAICVSRPLLAVPSMREARIGLPDYCRAIMGQQP